MKLEKTEKEQFDSLIEVVKLSNSFRDSEFTLLGTLDGDKTIETHCTIELDRYGSLFNFIRVWSGLNDDDKSLWKHEDITNEISDQEYHFLNDPDNKEMLDRVDEEQCVFTWSYGNEVIDKFINVNHLTTPKQLDKMFNDNWTKPGMVHPTSKGSH